ncbi:MAG: Rieske 2Fe-2S domain-containing protein [Ignavibacteria bacterium]|nr:Rieske 2Fe-2S domain-containing protein [Ignavibacteria bacterium]
MNDKGHLPEERRTFLKYLIGGGLIGFAGSVLYPLFAFLKPPKQADVEVTSASAGKLSEFEKGTGKIVRFGNKPLLVIRMPNGEVKAFSATCTHFDCTVQYKKDLEIIWCACHNGKYDLNGKNIAGPPPRPLDEYRVVMKGDEILISKKA